MIEHSFLFLQKKYSRKYCKIELFDELINELQKQFGEKIQEETELKDQLQRLEKQYLSIKIL